MGMWGEGVNVPETEYPGGGLMEGSLDAPNGREVGRQRQSLSVQQA